jgi:hypothetical protein
MISARVRAIHLASTTTGQRRRPRRLWPHHVRLLVRVRGEWTSPLSHARSPWCPGAPLERPVRTPAPRAGAVADPSPALGQPLPPPVLAPFSLSQLMTQSQQSLAAPPAGAPVVSTAADPRALSACAPSARPSTSRPPPVDSSRPPPEAGQRPHPPRDPEPQRSSAAALPPLAQAPAPAVPGSDVPDSVRRAAAMWAAESVPLGTLEAAVAESINTETAAQLINRVKSKIDTSVFSALWENSVREDLQWEDHQCRPLPDGVRAYEAGCPAPLVSEDADRKLELRLKTKNHAVEAFMEFCDPQFIANKVVPATNHYARVRCAPTPLPRPSRIHVAPCAGQAAVVHSHSAGRIRVHCALHSHGRHQEAWWRRGVLQGHRLRRRRPVCQPPDAYPQRSALSRDQTVSGASCAVATTDDCCRCWHYVVAEPGPWARQPPEGAHAAPPAGKPRAKRGAKAAAEEAKRRAADARIAGAVAGDADEVRCWWLRGSPPNRARHALSRVPNRCHGAWPVRSPTALVMKPPRPRQTVMATTMTMRSSGSVTWTSSRRTPSSSDSRRRSGVPCRVRLSPVRPARVLTAHMARLARAMREARRRRPKLTLNELHGATGQGGALPEQQQLAAGGCTVSAANDPAVSPRQSVGGMTLAGARAASCVFVLGCALRVAARLVHARQ